MLGSFFCHCTAVPLSGWVMQEKCFLLDKRHHKQLKYAFLLANVDFSTLSVDVMLLCSKSLTRIQLFWHAVLFALPSTLRWPPGSIQINERAAFFRFSHSIPASLNEARIRSVGLNKAFLHLDKKQIWTLISQLWLKLKLKILELEHLYLWKHAHRKSPSDGESFLELESFVCVLKHPVKYPRTT